MGQFSTSVNIATSAKNSRISKLVTEVHTTKLRKTAADRKVLLTLIQNNLVPENDDIELAALNQAVKDVSAGLAPRLGVEGTYSNDTVRRRLHCPGVRARPATRRVSGGRELTLFLFLLARYAVARGAVAARRVAPAEAALGAAARPVQLLALGVGPVAGVLLGCVGWALLTVTGR